MNPIQKPDRFIKPVRFREAPIDRKLIMPRKMVPFDRISFFFRFVECSNKYTSLAFSAIHSWIEIENPVILRARSAFLIVIVMVPERRRSLYSVLTLLKFIIMVETLQQLDFIVNFNLKTP